MAYLIDSDWIIDHLENDPAADQLLDGIAISVVTYMEGFQGSIGVQTLRRLQAD